MIMIMIMVIKWKYRPCGRGKLSVALKFAIHIPFLILDPWYLILVWHESNQHSHERYGSRVYRCYARGVRQNEKRGWNENVLYAPQQSRESRAVLYQAYKAFAHSRGGFFLTVKKLNVFHFMMLFLPSIQHLHLHRHLRAPESSLVCSFRRLITGRGYLKSK